MVERELARLHLLEESKRQVPQPSLLRGSDGGGEGECVEAVKRGFTWEEGSAEGEGAHGGLASGRRGGVTTNERGFEQWRNSSGRREHGEAG